MMANLAASLFAAEAHRHHRGQGQGPAPGGREAHHQGQEGAGPTTRAVHRIRQIQSYLGDKEMTAKLVDEVAPRYLRAPRRLHPHPEARPPPRRQRADGAHRAGLGPSRRSCRRRSAGAPRRAALTERSETAAEPRMHESLLVALRRHGFHGFAENAGVVTVGGTLRGRASSGCCGHPRRAHRRRAHRHRRARLGPGRLLRRPGRRPRPRTPGCSAASTGCAARRSPCARPRWSRPTSTPASRPAGAATATRS